MAKEIHQILIPYSKVLIDAYKKKNRADFSEILSDYFKKYKHDELSEKEDDFDNMETILFQVILSVPMTVSVAKSMEAVSPLRFLDQQSYNPKISAFIVDQKKS